MKHTPGPWRTERCSHGGAILARGTGLSDHPQPFIQILPTEDATLIAAAPTMLAALMGIAVIAEQHVHDLCAVIQEGGTLSAMDKMELHRWQSVGEAIAKAEGRGHDQERQG